MTSVLFVCLGNICRSPAAEGILRHKARQNPLLANLRVASCGVGDWHVGHLPNEKMRETSQLRGIVLTSRAQLFKPEFLDEFDYILAADREVLFDLHRHARDTAQKSKIHLMSVHSSLYPGEDIPDPYFGGQEGFELVFDMLEDCCDGLLNHLSKEHKGDGDGS